MITNVGELMKQLSRFPEDKPVKILALGIDHCDYEEIDEVDYACIHQDDEYDDKGNPIFITEEDCVYLFTKDYTEHMLMNGI